MPGHRSYTLKNEPESGKGFTHVATKKEVEDGEAEPGEKILDYEGSKKEFDDYLMDRYGVSLSQFGAFGEAANHQTLADGTPTHALFEKESTQYDAQTRACRWIASAVKEHVGKEAGEVQAMYGDVTGEVWIAVNQDKALKHIEENKWYEELGLGGDTKDKAPADDAPRIEHHIFRYGRCCTEHYRKRLNC